MPLSAARGVRREAQSKSRDSAYANGVATTSETATRIATHRHHAARGGIGSSSNGSPANGSSSSPVGSDTGSR